MSRQSRGPGRPRDHTLVARRRDEILEAATHVFAEMGYRQADVQLVADRLGMGKGTVYRYFPTKEDLFLAAVDRGMQQLKEQVDEAVEPVTEPLEQLSTGIRAYLAYFEANGDVLELVIQERAEFKDRKSTYFVYQEIGTKRWRSLFEGMIAQGRLRPMPVEQLLDVICDVLFGAIFTNRLAGRSKPLDAQAAEILDIVFYGILMPEQPGSAPDGAASGTQPASRRRK